jgi:hypothetical protein
MRLSLLLAATLAASAPEAHAVQFCPLLDGSMGKACTLSDGTVYGCVKDLKECGALLKVLPPESRSMKGRATIPPPSPTKPKD